MRTLQEALQEHIEKQRKADEQLAEEQRKEDEKRKAEEKIVAKAIGRLLDIKYDARISDEVDIRAIRESHAQSFSIVIRVKNGRIDLTNPVQLREGQITIVPLRHSADPEWKAVHDKLYCTYTNFLNAYLYAMHGDHRGKREMSTNLVS